MINNWKTYYKYIIGNFVLKTTFQGFLGFYMQEFKAILGLNDWIGYEIEITMYVPYSSVNWQGNFQWLNF